MVRKGLELPVSRLVSIVIVLALAVALVSMFLVPSGESSGKMSDWVDNGISGVMDSIFTFEVPFIGSDTSDEGGEEQMCSSLGEKNEDWQCYSIAQAVGEPDCPVGSTKRDEYQCEGNALCCELG